MSDINMVPFIDVMLVLLIIFMVTAPLIAPSVVDLPQVGAAAAKPDNVVEITVLADETLRLKKQDAAAQTVSLQTLKPHLNAQQAVVIAADKSVRYEAVMRLMDALKTAGVQRIALAVEKR